MLGRATLTIPASPSALAVAAAVTGGFADEALGHVPGQPARDDVDAWIAGLNAFSVEQMARYAEANEAFDEAIRLKEDAGHIPLVRLAHADALRTQRLIHLDCGTRDEYHLHLGAREFSRALTALGIAHHHEEYPDGHMNVSYRYDVSLPRLTTILAEPVR